MPKSLEAFLVSPAERMQQRSVVPGSASTVLTGPLLDTFPRGHAAPARPGSLAPFATATRGGADVLAPAASVFLPAIARGPANTGTRLTNGTSVLTRALDASAIASGVPRANRTLDDVWRHQLAAHSADVLADIDPALIGRPAPGAAEGSTVVGVHVVPEHFGNGKVQPPAVSLIEVPQSALEDDGARCLSPAARRQIFASQLEVHRGKVALREARCARAKLLRVSNKLYPHGALGIADGPYADAPLQQTAFDADDTYSPAALQLTAEERRVTRKMKSVGTLAPAATGTGVARCMRREPNGFFGGAPSEAEVRGDLAAAIPRASIRVHGIRPVDQLKSLAPN